MSDFIGPESVIQIDSTSSVSFVRWDNKVRIAIVYLRTRDENPNIRDERYVVFNLRREAAMAFAREVGRMARGIKPSTKRSIKKNAPRVGPMSRANREA